MEDFDFKKQDISGLITTAAYDTKINEVDNKIFELSGLVKKTDYDAKILEIEGEYFTIFDYGKCVSDIIDAMNWIFLILLKILI